MERRVGNRYQKCGFGINIFHRMWGVDIRNMDLIPDILNELWGSDIRNTNLISTFFCGGGELVSETQI